MAVRSFTAFTFRLQNCRFASATATTAFTAALVVRPAPAPTAPQAGLHAGSDDGPIAGRGKRHLTCTQVGDGIDLQAEVILHSDSRTPQGRALPAAFRLHTNPPSHEPAAFPS